jgi:hypothetical protein
MVSRSRAGIKSFISYIKHDPWMRRNYFSGSAGGNNNTLLAAAVCNMKKCIRLEKQKHLDLIFGWLYLRFILVLMKSKLTEYMKNGY